MNKEETVFWINNPTKFEQLLTFYINGEFRVFKALEITNDLSKDELDKLKKEIEEEEKTI